MAVQVAEDVDGGCAQVMVCMRSGEWTCNHMHDAGQEVIGYASKMNSTQTVQ